MPKCHFANTNIPTKILLASNKIQLASEFLKLKSIKLNEFPYLELYLEVCYRDLQTGKYS